jgi:hypothetical protein
MKSAYASKALIVTYNKTKAVHGSNSSLISRSSKLQIYHTLVRPVVTHGSESRTLTLEEERALTVFERKILRKIYGTVKGNESWRIRQNDELEDIIKGENIVRFIKRQRIRWLGHIERMQGTAMPSLAAGTYLHCVRQMALAL